MGEIKISIIVPVYNGRKYIRTCLDSILNQTYKNIELIIINDGSTDETDKICKEYEIKDDRIKYLYKKNEGVSIARNLGISQCTGSYILFVDCDDFLPLDSIYYFANNLINKCDIIIGSYSYIRFNKLSKKIVFEDACLNYSEFVNDFFKYKTAVSKLWGNLYKSEIIKNHQILFSPDLTYGEDCCFNLDYIKYAKYIQVSNNVVYNYRLGGYASSVRYHNNINVTCKKLLEKYAIIFDNKIIFDLFEKLLSSSLNHYVLNCNKDKAIEKMNETIGMFYEVEINNELKPRIIEILNSYKNSEVYYNKYYKNNFFKIIKFMILKKIRQIIRV